MAQLTYPHHSILNEAETIFSNGVKFQILEFIKEAQSDFNIEHKNRFFLLIDDCYYAHNSLLDFANLDVNLAWRRYCTDKAFLKSIISDIENVMDSINSLEEKSSKVKEGKYNPFKEKIDSLRKTLYDKCVKY